MKTSFINLIYASPSVVVSNNAVIPENIAPPVPKADDSSAYQCTFSDSFFTAHHDIVECEHIIDLEKVQTMFTTNF